jgi:hypothetical protein
LVLPPRDRLGTSPAFWIKWVGFWLLKELPALSFGLSADGLITLGTWHPTPFPLKGGGSATG